jgi:hypothetical protein
MKETRKQSSLLPFYIKRAKFDLKGLVLIVKFCKREDTYIEVFYFGTNIFQLEIDVFKE